MFGRWAVGDGGLPVLQLEVPYVPSTSCLSRYNV